MKDNLESFFRKHLSDESPGEDNWNVPSEEVWKNVVPEIQKKRGVFIPWKYFYLLGLLAFTAFLFILFLPAGHDSRQALDGDTVVLETTGPEPVKTNENNPENRQKSRKEKMQTAFGDESTATTEQPVKTDGKTDKETFPTGRSVQAKSTAAGKVTENYPEDGKVVSLPVFNRGDREGIISEITPRFFLPDFADTLKLKMKERPAEIPGTIKTPVEPVALQGKFGLGIFFLPTLTSTYLTGEMVPGMIKTGNMFLYSSNYGLELKYYLSGRFALVTGVERSEIKSWAKSMVDFAYDGSTEKPMPGSQKQNTSAVPMPTPFGQINTEITYQFSASDTLPDGEPMQSEMETHQSVVYFSIPLGVEFNIFRPGHLNWFAESGLRYSRAIRDATEFSSRILHLGNEMEVVDQQMISHSSYTINYLGYYLGLGVNYKLSTPFQISASTRYFGSITHINLQDNMSTYVHGFALKLGVSYFF